MKKDQFKHTWPQPPFAHKIDSKVIHQQEVRYIKESDKSPVRDGDILILDGKNHKQTNLAKHYEHALQSQIVQYLRANQVFCFAVPNAGMRSVGAARYYKQEGLLSGCADLLILLPQAKTIFVELKVGKNQQTQRQMDFELGVRSLGFSYQIWRTFDDAINFINTIKEKR
jgi:cobyric acid synthase